MPERSEGEEAATGRVYRDILEDDAAPGAFVDKLARRVATMTHARHRTMLDVVLGESLEHQRLFEQAAAGFEDVLGRRTGGVARVGAVLPERWQEYHQQVGQRRRSRRRIASAATSAIASATCARRSPRSQPSIQHLRVSSFHDTAPVGVGPQPRFLNAAAVGETTLTARALLDTLLAHRAASSAASGRIPARRARSISI